MRSLATQGIKRAVVESYFAATERPTVSGLARVLGKRRGDLVGYKGKDAVVVEGLARVEEYLESRLGTPSPPASLSKEPFFVRKG